MLSYCQIWIPSSVPGCSGLSGLCALSFMTLLTWSWRMRTGAPLGQPAFLISLTALATQFSTLACPLLELLGARLRIISLTCSCSQIHLLSKLAMHLIMLQKFILSMKRWDQFSEKIKHRDCKK